MGKLEEIMENLLKLDEILGIPRKIMENLMNFWDILQRSWEIIEEIDGHGGKSKGIRLSFQEVANVCELTPVNSIELVSLSS